MIATTAAIACASAGLSKLTAILVFVITAAPVIALDSLWPPPLDLSGAPTGLEFEFSDADYAVEFARLNGVVPEEP